MKIIVAETAGFCYGVSSAVDLCFEAAGKHKKCVTLGPIIHNKHVVSQLKEAGVDILNSIHDVSADDTVIIRTHGATKHDIDYLSARCKLLIDATCHDVKKIHKIVEAESALGNTVIVIGKKHHPEVVAISGWCDYCVIIESPSELSKWLDDNKNIRRRISVVFQTTNTKQVLSECNDILKKKCTNYRIFDTICNATTKRQNEAEEIAKRSDIVFVVGDVSSANTQKLAEVCTKHCANVNIISSADDLGGISYNDFDVIGITAGASTPTLLIQEVHHRMSKEIMDGLSSDSEQTFQAAPSVAEDSAQTLEAAPPVADTSGDNIALPEITPEADPEQDFGEISSESFEEMLEKSIKTLRTGEKVVGVVTSITSTEVSVDLGTKQSGYIPLSEFLSDDDTSIDDVVKVGDSIESYVMRVNDVEGMVVLSKRRLDSDKNWDIFEEARDKSTVLEGFVVEENKGGIVVNIKGARVFVPASQTGLPKSTPLTQLLKTKVKLKINEVNQSRRRVVGSMRAVFHDERREKSDKVWSDIEVGKVYDGVVKSMTTYGVFVDIGGVDGMIHISELSWTRIKQPSEVMSLGDEVSVHVLSFDRDARKISLGYKKSEDNPWTKFTENYAVGDNVKVKIVKLMPFGAFAEICSGIDGLIHISQIANHRITLPSDVLETGQEVEVRITEIDNNKKKVSLSIRELLTNQENPSSTKPEVAEPEATAAEADDKSKTSDAEDETLSAIEADTKQDTEGLKDEETVEENNQ